MQVYYICLFFVNSEPQWRKENEKDAVEKVKGRCQREEEEPDPEKQKHLVIVMSLVMMALVTFSLMMLRDKMQMLLNFCSPAAVPTEWKVQLSERQIIFHVAQVVPHPANNLVTVGKTVQRGLGSCTLFSCSSARYSNTRLPYLEHFMFMLFFSETHHLIKRPPRKKFVR